MGAMAKKSMITAVNEEALVTDTLNSFESSGCKGCVAYMTESKIIIVYTTIKKSVFFIVRILKYPFH